MDRDACAYSQRGVDACFSAEADALADGYCEVWAWGYDSKQVDYRQA